MKKIVIGIIIATVILVVGFVPIMEAEYRYTETYCEDEPYEVTETYYETVPLAYEVVGSYTDTDSYEERRQIIIGGIVFQDEVVEVFYPIGCVTIQNKDSVDGTFSVHLTFYWLDRHDAAQLCHPDFEFTDYLAAEDPDSYLDELNWDRLDSEAFMFFAEKCDAEEILTLEPGETATVEYSAPEIDMDKDVWKWEYTTTESTKEVEQEKTVTKYRQVEKERLVIQYRKVPIFQYLRSRP